MGQIKVTKAPIEGLYIIEPAVHGDSRGYFMETYNQRDMEEAGLHLTFVQDNQSMSTKGVLRGLHFQKEYPQGKLVRVIKGKVFDVAVDLRKDSATYGKWFGVELTEENKKQFYISEGFAHGFLVLSDVAEFCYKVTDFYHPGDEGACLERPVHRHRLGRNRQIQRHCLGGGIHPSRRHPFKPLRQRSEVGYFESVITL